MPLIIFLNDWTIEFSLPTPSFDETTDEIVEKHAGNFAILNEMRNGSSKRRISGFCRNQVEFRNGFIMMPK